MLLDTSKFVCQATSCKDAIDYRIHIIDDEVYCGRCGRRIFEEKVPSIKEQAAAHLAFCKNQE